MMEEIKVKGGLFIHVRQCANRANELGGRQPNVREGTVIERSETGPALTRADAVTG